MPAERRHAPVEPEAAIEVRAANATAAASGSAGAGGVHTVPSATDSSGEKVTETTRLGKQTVVGGNTANGATSNVGP